MVQARTGLATQTNKPIAVALLVAVSAIIRSLFGSDRPFVRLGVATGPCLFGNAQCKSLKRRQMYCRSNRGLRYDLGCVNSAPRYQVEHLATR
jgi:hypothetical protein